MDRFSAFRLAAAAGFLCLLPVASVRAAPAPHRTAQAVDERLADEWAGNSVRAEPEVDDETFLRRATLDLVGDLPTPDQVTAFVLDPSAGKRAAAIDRLLADREFGQNWARYWRDVILSRRADERSLLVAPALVVYLTEELNKGTPWNVVAREFITATGDASQDGRTAIIIAQQAMTEETAAEMSRIFLGVQIQCAQCHDDKTARWTRWQFHELAAFFPRIALQRGGNRNFIVTANDSNRQPRKNNGRGGAAEHLMPDLEDPTAQGTQMRLRFFLTDQTLPWGTPDAERRSTVAAWMTESPWFAKAFVNRVWSELIGQGFYEPVDDLGPDRDCAAPKTMDYLAGQFVESGYDVKWLYRTIMATRTYQREIGTTLAGDSTADGAACRRLRADPLYNALTSALGIGELGESNRPDRRNDYLGGRGPRVQFNLVFGYDPSLSADDVTSSIPQALALMNAPQINRYIDARSAASALGRLVDEVDDNEAVVVELYLRTFAREPRQAELETCLEHVAEAGSREEAFEDILWGLVNSTEFLHRR